MLTQKQRSSVEQRHVPRAAFCTSVPCGTWRCMRPSYLRRGDRYQREASGMRARRSSISRGISCDASLSLRPTRAPPATGQPGMMARARPALSHILSQLQVPAAPTVATSGHGAANRLVRDPSAAWPSEPVRGESASEHWFVGSGSSLNTFTHTVWNADRAPEVLLHRGGRRQPPVGPRSGACWQPGWRRTGGQVGHRPSRSTRRSGLGGAVAEPAAGCRSHWGARAAP